ncbi:MAG: hypothetical protein Tsb0016_25610 [Sphingomonadales bacterium]
MLSIKPLKKSRKALAGCSNNAAMAPARGIISRAGLTAFALTAAHTLLIFCAEPYASEKG